MKTNNNLSLEKYNKEKDELNMSGISGHGSTTAFNETGYDLKFTNSDLSHNGSRKRLNTSINTEGFVKDKMKFSLFGNSSNVKEGRENQDKKE